MPQVDSYILRLPTLPPRLDGFRILLMSDIHAGAFMGAEQISEVVECVNSLESDLVVLAGDLVDGTASVEEIHDCAVTLGGLRASHGAVAVPGNHEHFAGVENVCRELAAVGISVLRGGYRSIERGGDVLVILGVDDPRVGQFDPPQAEAVSLVAARSPVGAWRVLVAHRPGAFDAASRLGIPLTLAGHTHGGQIRLPPGDLTPVRLLSRYVRGHYRRGEDHLIVSSGVGTGQVPFRFGVPPSVAHLTLRRA